MITWMQRHRKYLIITIWISTIAFVGAGFVGWGQYSYGDKSTSIAKVGEVGITQRELQQVYSQLFSQYNKMFQGKFDQEQAKSFGLQKQALTQLVNTAFIINLAKELQLNISDAEVYAMLKTEEVFFKNGAFDKDVYKSILKRNHLIPSDYEDDMKKALLVQKMMQLLEPKVSELEIKSVTAAMYIADKIDYKILDPKDITIDMSDEALKAYYETNKMNYNTNIVYKLETITQENITKEYDVATLSEYYNSHKHNFKDSEGKLLTLENATAQIKESLNDKESKKAALKTYIAFKKDKLSSDVVKTKLEVTQNSANFPANVFSEVIKATTVNPYIKPRKINTQYVVLKLEGTTPSRTKTFEEAKIEVLQAYLAETKRSKVIELANNSVKSFKGNHTDFITREDVESLKELNEVDAAEFLNKLFEQHNKNGYVLLNNGKIVLFNILEQKLLDKENENAEALALRLKQSLLNQGLIKVLQNKYPTEMFVKGI